MRNGLRTITAAFVVGLAAVGAAYAGTNHSGTITVSQTWTAAQNPHHLNGTVIVANGATLTIEANVVVASFTDAYNPDPNFRGGGTLVVQRGAKIKVMGKPGAPVILTSANDVGTWAGFAGTKDANGIVSAITSIGDPNSGHWRMSCNEWGNITILGRGYVSASHLNNGTQQRVWNDGNGNVACDRIWDGNTRCPMEGLLEGQGDILYGGTDDDDSSGELHYVSFRYGGKVVSAANELNGLSMGGVGRGTKIDHIDIMNNVDDGIETWGGTVCYKYISIWNIGDDCFDVDQGWRGKAQFLCLVQGYSVAAAQGSGVGDNIFEIDGAEDGDAQPCTTAAIYNATAIGQFRHPTSSGDQGIALRNNACVQFRKCLFMDVGEKLIKNDGSDSGALPGNNDQALPTGAGYGGTNPTLGGGYGQATPAGTGAPTLNWNETWTTSYAAAWNKSATLVSSALAAKRCNHVNAGDWTEANLQMKYASQTDGMLLEFSDNLVFNLNPAFTDDANAALGLGGYDGGLWNAAFANVKATVLPIRSITREANQYVSGNYMANVTALDPRLEPARSADWTSTRGTPSGDTFFANVPYKGAFSKDVNWMIGWTTASAYGYFAGQVNAANPNASYVVSTAASLTGLTAGVVYTLEKSTDMVNWKPIGTFTATGTTYTVSDPDAYDTTAFYRAIAQ